MHIKPCDSKRQLVGALGSRQEAEEGKMHEARGKSDCVVYVNL